MKNCAECKAKHRAGPERRALLNRLARIEGQVRGLRRQVEADAYCVDILTQAAAAQAALAGFSRKLLDAHIRSCVSEGIRAGDDEVVDELVGLLEKMMK